MTSKRIVLFHEGDPGSETRTQNERGKVYRAQLHDGGTELVTQADIIGVANGTLAEGGPPATLLIFDFHFISTALNESRRFQEAKITLTVTAADKAENVANPSADPEVLAV